MWDRSGLNVIWQRYFYQAATLKKKKKKSLDALRLSWIGRCLQHACQRQKKGGWGAHCHCYIPESTCYEQLAEQSRAVWNYLWSCLWCLNLPSVVKLRAFLTGSSTSVPDGARSEPCCTACELLHGLPGIYVLLIPETFNTGHVLIPGLSRPSTSLSWEALSAWHNTVTVDDNDLLWWVVWKVKCNLSDNTD